MFDELEGLRVDPRQTSSSFLPSPSAWASHRAFDQFQVALLQYLTRIKEWRDRFSILFSPCTKQRRMSYGRSRNETAREDRDIGSAVDESSRMAALRKS